MEIFHKTIEFRLLSEIKDEIAECEVKIAALKTEIKEFQKACPHSTQFLKRKQRTYKDEYGNEQETSYWAECTLCGTMSKELDIESHKVSTFDSTNIIYEWS